MNNIKVPKFPRHDTLTGRALSRLMQSKKITHRDFDGASHSYRLSSYIGSLRHHHGWEAIETISERAKTNDVTGRYAIYGRYQIPDEFLTLYRQAIGLERWNAFIQSVQKFERGQG